jgi:hypothetical protein
MPTMTNLNHITVKQALVHLLHNTATELLLRILSCHQVCAACINEIGI